MTKMQVNNLGFSVRALAALLLSLFFNSVITYAEVKIAPGSDGNQLVIKDPDITIYNQNRALIKEKRLFDLETGVNNIDWDNLAPSIDIHSISLRSANANKPIIVKAQNYQNDLLNPATILNHSVGKTVYLKRFLSDGRSEEQSGILLASPSGPDNCVVKIGDRYVICPQGQIELSELPSNLLAQPKLSFTVKASESSPQDLLLSYGADNINWQCDYSLLLDQTQNKCDLTGWITLTNQCGLSFKRANLKLIAGNIQIVNRIMPIAAARAGLYNAMDIIEAAPQEQAFADYHLYTFPEPIDINNNEIKRLALIERKAIPINKKYIFEQQYYSCNPAKQKIPVQIKLEFKNDEKYKSPLPAGEVKVYQDDTNKEIQLIGEDRITHTAVGEKVTVKLGDAFDVLGERTCISSEKITPSGRKDNYKVTFKNHLDKDIVINDIEHIPHLASFTSDMPFTKVNSDTFQYDVKVPSNGVKELNYTIELRN